MSSVSVVTTETLSPRRNGARQVTEVINIKNSGRALGIKIIGGKSSIGTAEFGIFVKKILAGGVAELDDKQIDLKNTNLKKLRVKQLKKILNDFDEECYGCVEKSDYVKKIESIMKEHTEL